MHQGETQMESRKGIPGIAASSLSCGSLPYILRDAGCVEKSNDIIEDSLCYTSVESRFEVIWTT